MNLSTRSSTSLRRSMLLPSAQPAPGGVLWGEAPRRQPIVPLLAMAILVLLVAAPAAMSGNGQSANPMVLMHQTAESLHTVTTMLDEINGHLAQIDEYSAKLPELRANMESINATSTGMAASTAQLDTKLGGVATSVRGARSGLTEVNGKLGETADGVDGLSAPVNSSLAATRGMVEQFGSINASIGRMDRSLESTIALMATSKPLTTKFATNTTRTAIVGGDSSRYNVPNVMPGTRVMSVVLPMISAMQDGGTMALRKDSATGSNPLIQSIVNRQIPNGANLIVHVTPYDGTFGLPGKAYFINNRVGGF